MRFVRFVDDWQIEEYGIFERDGVTAEVVFLAANPRTTVALDFRLATRDAMETFSVFSGPLDSWAPAEAVPGWRRQLFYRSFAVATSGRACVGFSGSWDTITEDPEKRPRNALFGYVCNPPNVAMGPDEALAIVSAIRVDAAAAWLSARRQDRSGGSAALAFARGTAGQGNPSFPFRLARFYVVGNGRSGFD